MRLLLLLVVGAASAAEDPDFVIPPSTASQTLLGHFRSGPNRHSSMDRVLRDVMLD